MNVPLDDNTPTLRSAFALAGAVLILSVGLVAAWDSWYVVNPGERAVEFNRATGSLETHDDGIQFKLPLFESVDRYNVRGQLYTTVAWGASRDLQDVHADVAITYHPEPAAVERLHREYGPDYAGVVLAPAVQEVVKAVTARYNADELISKRTEVKGEIVEQLRERMTRVRVVLQEVDVRDFDFSDSFNAAIEAKVTAQQKALEEENRLAEVRFKAQQKEASANGDANATRTRAQAEADAARLISEQIRQDPLYLDYLKIQRWNGELPRVSGSDAGISLLVNSTGG